MLNNAIRKKHRFSGFTLVELIVVITILVILGTIAFLNLGSFSGTARDGARVSDLTNISKGLEILYIKNGRVPAPDASMVTITASGVAIWYQWYAGLSILSQIKMGDARDPLDKKYYTYLVNGDYTKYQLLGLLEDSSTTVTSFVPLVPSVYAGYETRIPTTKGSALGVLLGNSGSSVNQPVQETLVGSLELTTSTGWLYRAYVSKTNIISATWSALGGLAGIYNVKSAGSTYPGCDTRDILLPNGQIWAACNMGATSAYAGQSIPNCSASGVDCDANMRYFLWSYFQWGRNENVAPLGTRATLADTGTLSSTVIWSYIINASASDWMMARNDDLWWWSGTTSTWGTYLTQSSPNTMQWPCASGYHVPTIFEWWSTLNTLNPSLTNSSTFQNDTIVASILKLPLVWYRHKGAWAFDGQGFIWYYWSSTPIGASWGGYNISISSTQIWPQKVDGRAFGFSLRCIKN